MQLLVMDNAVSFVRSAVGVMLGPVVVTGFGVRVHAKEQKLLATQTPLACGGGTAMIKRVMTQIGCRKPQNLNTLLFAI